MQTKASAHIKDSVVPERWKIWFLMNMCHAETATINIWGRVRREQKTDV